MRQAMQFFTTTGGENTKLFFQPPHRYDPPMTVDKL
jgi:hypothetical protein